MMRIRSRIGADQEELWYTDGTPDGTIRLSGSDTPVGALRVADNPTQSFLVVDDLLFFSAFRDDVGVELFVSDGTIEGTRIVRDIHPGEQGSNPWFFVDYDGELFFSTSWAALEPWPGLWKSDGSGAQKVFDYGGSSPFFLEVVEISGSLDDFLDGRTGNANPESIGLSTDRIDETVAVGTAVGRLIGTDPDGDTLRFTLIDDAGGRFALSGDRLVTAEPLSVRGNTFFDLIVNADDGNGGTLSESVRVFVRDVPGGGNRRPTDIALSDATVSEGEAGRVVGRFTATDPDDDRLSYRLIDDADGWFTLSGRRLVTAERIDVEDDTRVDVRVQVRDPAGLRYAESFEVTVTADNRATNGSDTLSGTRGADVMDGRGGNDHVLGGAGDDMLSGGGGRDRVAGGRGDDDMSGDRGDDRMAGGGGNDRMRGGAGDDALSGDGGADRLWGDGGDRLDGGRGDDTMDGGAGKDLFVYGRRGGDDLIVGFERRVDEIDVSAFELTPREGRRLVSQDAGGVTIDFGRDGCLRLEGMSFADLSPTDFLL